MTKPLWTPTADAVATSQMMAFIDFVNQQYDQKIISYEQLHQWSIKNLEFCWQSIWAFCNVIASRKTNTILRNADNMEKATWFEDAKLNFAENLLQHRSDKTALISVSENNQKRKLTYDELYQQVSALAHFLKENNIKPGDRIAAFMPNTQETIIAMLATTAVGAVWSSCSPDFGLQGLLDRFEQIKPKILFAI
ncbi:MAG: AMP-binding protein, partial [Coxiellaceae bacterium]|nr:AMP-binding protein [Coxiellaceae bacterium]